MEEKNLSLPIAIVIAGLIIAGTIYYTNNDNKKNDDNQAAVASDQVKQPSGPKEVTSSDHLLGDPQAPLTFIIFTDLECPWCKKFNQIVTQMMEDYGKQGKVKLVFRQFPLDSLHKKSRKEAEATECAADLGGNEKFWQYVNKIFEITPSNDGLDSAELPKIASEIGLDQNKFNDCLNSGKFSQKVQADYNDAIASGANGTPFSIAIDSKGEKFPLNGYLSYEQLKVFLDQILNKK